MVSISSKSLTLVARVENFPGLFVRLKHGLKKKKNKNMKQMVDAEEVLMTGESLEDELLASSQETVTVEGSTIDVS